MLAHIPFFKSLSSSSSPVIRLVCHYQYGAYRRITLIRSIPGRTGLFKLVDTHFWTLLDKPFPQEITVVSSEFTLTSILD
jgi:hypothetical protein